MPQADIHPSTRIIRRLPFVAHGSFWTVAETGQHEVDCRVGRLLANEAIGVIRTTDSGFLLGWIARDQGKGGKLDSVAVGFWQRIAEQAIFSKGAV